MTAKTSKFNFGVLSLVISVLALGLGFFALYSSTLFGNQYEEVEFQQAVNGAIDQYIADQKAAAADEATKSAVREVEVPKGIEDDDAVLGDEDAPVTIVEFSDYQCPYCARFWAETFPQLKSEYIDTGKVKFVYRDYPLGSHPNALPMANFAECYRDQKGDEGYFEAHDYLFQNGWNLNDALAFAGDNGVDVGDLEACQTGSDFEEEILADMQEGSKAGVDGTPGFFIGETHYVSGAQPYAVFKDLIDQQL